jgi:ATP-binding cassette subfamily F protein 3
MQPMAVVSLRNVCKQFGPLVVLDGVTLEIASGETVGLVGANGAGKTTLFRLIAGELEPDLGQVIRSRGLQIGHLQQEPEVDPDRTLVEDVGSAFADLFAMEQKVHALADEIATKSDDPGLAGLMDEYERINTRFIAAGGHSFEVRMNEILGGLGFTPAEHSKRMATLSGGQRCRAALARLLLEDRQLLLLDEPTNHLDIDAVQWLEKFLSGHRGGTVVVSHDRFLLDRLCDRIVEVERMRVTSYPGNYSNFVQTKERRELTQERQFEKDQEFIKKERAFIAKHIARQRSAEAKGRRTRLERRLAAGEFVTEVGRKKRDARIEFAAAEVSAETAVRCEDLAMDFGEGPLFSGLSFQILPGQRLGITGPNGTGKTTLLRILLGDLAATSGRVELDPKLKIAYFAQDAEDLDERRTLIEELRAAHESMSEFEARSYLAMFLFTGDDVFKRIGQLSGGQQSRLRLAKLILDRPDALVLDEPTNHLDIPSREALEAALCAYNGTVIAVSHDRYFLDRIAQRLLVMRPEGHRLCEGNYSFYLTQLEAGRNCGPLTDGPTPARRGGAPRGKARPQPVKAAASPYDRLSVEELESMVIERESRLGQLHERFAAPAVYKDPDALEELKEQIEDAERDLAEVDAAWQERVDAGQG